MTYFETEVTDRLLSWTLAAYHRDLYLSNYHNRTESNDLSSFFYEFCGKSVIWDYELSWRTTKPIFTRCFFSTILTWIPILLWSIFLPFELLYIYRSRRKPLRWNSFNILRLILLYICLVLAFVRFTHLTYIKYNPRKILPSNADLTSAIIKFVAYLQLIICIHFHRLKGIITSGRIWIFLLVELISSSIFFYQLWVDSSDFTNIEKYCHLLYFPFLLGSFFIFCYADRPYRLEDDDSLKQQGINSNPEYHISFSNFITFSYFNKLAYLGWKRNLVVKDLWDSLEELNPDKLATEFSFTFKKTKTKTKQGESQYDPNCFSSTENLIPPSSVLPRKKIKGSVVKTIIKIYGPYLFVSMLIDLVNDLLDFAFPFLFRILINFIEKGLNEPIWHGFIAAFMMFMTSTVQTLLSNIYFYRSTLVFVKMKTSLIGFIYRKTFLLNNKSKNENEIGKMTNLMSVDSQQISNFFLYLNSLVSCPIKIILTIYFLYAEMGYSTFFGFCIMLLLVPLNGIVTNFSKRYQLEQMKFKDERVKVMSEIINGIKVIKFYAWENSFIDIIQKIRKKELSSLKKFFYFQSIISFIWNFTPTLVILATFSVYVTLQGGVLTAEKAFVSLSLFNILRFPLTLLPMLITISITAIVSLKRVSKFLNSDELQNYITRYDDVNAVKIKNGYFFWNYILEKDSNKDKTDTSKTSVNEAADLINKEVSSNDFMLKSINFYAKKGEFVAIVGPVASGKSSLLSAILGDMEINNGTVNILKGLNIAYVPQDAWILNQTLRDNILFGKEFDEEKYNKIISCCALRPDLRILPNGDQTEIGENGINLSGGQKQRVSLARACYNDADIYLLDDPLSAVDANVANYLFEKVLDSTTGLFKNKTRIIVTNKLEVLPHTDRIFVLKEGRISEFGTYKNLMDKKGDFAELIKHFSFTSELKIIKTDENKENEYLFSNQTPKHDHNDNRLIKNEHVETGKVSFKIYKFYIKLMSFFWVLLLFLGCVSSECSTMGSNLWLASWSSDKNSSKSNTHRRLTIYAIFGLIKGLSCFTASISNIKATLRVAHHAHKNLLTAILRAPIRFFHTTPSGRIINRFSKDINTVDCQLMGTIDYCLKCCLTIISSFLMISLQTPWFMTVIIPITVLYYFVQKFYIPASRQLRRLDSITMSPIYSQFNETIVGVSTIRAYNDEKRFTKEIDKRIDNNLKCYFSNMIGNRWLSIRLEFFSNIIVFFASLFAILARDTITPGQLGISITYAISTTFALSWLVRTTCDLENKIVSVERISEFINVENEAEWIGLYRPQENWPSKGNIEFHNYSTRYLPDTDLIIKNFSAKIYPNEKIGIVGRTGAGKSTMTLALFRIIEAVEGKIIIDDLDISCLGLHDLRKRLAIIPQDPVIFSGVLRFNLDPFNQFSDDELWQALQQAHLKEFVAGLDSKLDYQISENGRNLSLGQRQLICLARALLKKPKILVLDEATASVDCVTDNLIQSTIRSEFKECTILTIAHRLNTILDSDRIIVMNNGTIAEIGSPNELLQNEQSLFYALAKVAGLV